MADHRTKHQRSIEGQALRWTCLDHRNGAGATMYKQPYGFELNGEPIGDDDGRAILSITGTPSDYDGS